MKKISAGLVLVILAVLSLFLFKSSPEPPQASGVTVMELKSEWDRIDASMQELLESDFQQNAPEAIKVYTDIKESPRFEYTVFRTQAGHRIYTIRKKLEKTGASAVSEPDETAQLESPDTQPGKKPAETVKAEKTPEETPQPEPAPVAVPAEKTPEPDTSPVPEGTAASQPAAEREASLLYNKAFSLYEQESYRDAHDLFTRLLAEYGETGFCAKRKSILYGYVGRSRILADYPGVVLYLNEDFEFPGGSWKGEYITEHCFQGSKGALRGVPLSIPGTDGLKQTGSALISGEETGLFRLEKGQRINFSYYIRDYIPLHVHLWDREKNVNYYFNLNRTECGEWKTVSIPLSEFRNNASDSPVTDDVSGVCWYLSVSGALKDGEVLAVDSISVTGEKLPGPIQEAVQQTPPGITSYLGTDHFLFNRTIAEHLCRKVDPDAEKGSILLAGDYMTGWIDTGLPLHSPRELRDSRVTGTRKSCREIAENIGTVLREKKPEVTLILAGLSDVLTASGAAVRSSYEKTVTECLKNGSIPVLFGLPRVWDDAAGPRVERLNEELRKLAAAYRIPYVDTSGVFSGDNERSFYRNENTLTATGKQKLSQVFHTLYRKIDTYVTTSK